MMTTGQTLTKVELYNWGNFHGLHEIDLFPQETLGPLLAPPPSSAILGVNGSGKSTLIDGIMFTLLPFENFLKLGVTNDYEKGSGGGRKGEDYVLGKFASSDGNVKDLSTIYNRQSGISFFQLSFKHNERKDSIITVGTVWWYNNYKITNRLFYTSQSGLRIRDLCPGNELPKNAKVFKEHFQTKGLNPQTFESSSSYFTILSTLLGGITKEDLKLFNRAFYVKSIENINYFIRENMLIHEENKNLVNLLENVSNGGQITQQIDLCRKKLEGTDKILEVMKKLIELQDKVNIEEREKSFIELFSYWLPLTIGEEELGVMKLRKEECKRELPLWETKSKSLSDQISTLKDQLLNSESARALSLLEGRMELMQEKIRLYQKEKQNFQKVLEMASLKFSPALTGLKVLSLIQEKDEEVKLEIQTKKQLIEKLFREEHVIGDKILGVKSELTHLETHQTLIPRHLYEIKLIAQKELKLVDHALMFVGETLTVHSAENRRAVEASLWPIARNLLAHPDCLDKFTTWLDKTGLSTTVTVKRLSMTDLSGTGELLSQDKASILSMITIRNIEENPFYHYLIKWLNSSYSYQLVSAGEFKRGSGLLVTKEGLVKRDKSTMTKLKKDFPYSLGWNPLQRIEALTQDLVQLEASLKSVKEKIKSEETLLDFSKELQGELKRYDALEKLDFLTLSEWEKELKKLQEEITELKKKSQDLSKLTEALKEKESLYQSALTEMASLSAEERRVSQEAEKIEAQLPRLHSSFKSSRAYRELISPGVSEEELIKRLKTARSKLEGEYRKVFEEIEGKLRKFSVEKDSLLSRVSGHLIQYKNEFQDPNLSYALTSMEKVKVLMESWSAHREKLEKSELAHLQEKWRLFFNDVLINSIRDTLDEIRAQAQGIQDNILSINRVLAINHFEKLPTEERYLKIELSPSQHESIRKFKKESSMIEKIFSTPENRSKLEAAEEEVMTPLKDFVTYLKEDTKEREFVTDVRNHFQFKVQSWVRRNAPLEDEVVETFTGSSHDAKSSAQTTHLAYTLLASSLAYRFRFNDHSKGYNTPRMIILDEFGGKFDNERPRDILQMLSQMGFQPILVSPMTKAEILADDLCYITLVHKASASKSKAQSFQIQSREDYNKMVRELSRSGFTSV